jgi:uncharacterized protein (TIGR03435 family)
VAKTDASITAEDEMLPLLQPLLADRFHLTMHRATRQLSAYALTVGPNGPKLEAADPGSNGLPFKKASKSGGGHIQSDNLTMPQFADILSRRLSYPVLDRTGLRGAYRVKLEWDAGNNGAKPDKAEKAKPGSSPLDTNTDRPSIFTALHDQMGLRLQATKAPAEILVIDHIDKTPAEN